MNFEHKLWALPENFSGKPQNIFKVNEFRTQTFCPCLKVFGQTAEYFSKVSVRNSASSSIVRSNPKINLTYSNRAPKNKTVFPVTEGINVALELKG